MNWFGTGTLGKWGKGKRGILSADGRGREKTGCRKGGACFASWTMQVDIDLLIMHTWRAIAWPRPEGGCKILLSRCCARIIYVLSHVPVFTKLCSLGINVSFSIYHETGRSYNLSDRRQNYGRACGEHRIWHL